MNAEKIITILQGLLVPVIAIVTTYIAYQQHKINKQRESRESKQAKLKTYKKLKTVLNHFDMHITLPKEMYDLFKEAFAEADFLFPEDVLEWLGSLEKLIDEADDWQSIAKSKIGPTANLLDICNKYRNNNVMQEDVKNVSRLVDDLHSAYAELRKTFSKSMEL